MGFGEPMRGRLSERMAGVSASRGPTLLALDDIDMTQLQGIQKRSRFIAGSAGGGLSGHTWQVDTEFGA